MAFSFPSFTHVRISSDSIMNMFFLAGQCILLGLLSLAYGREEDADLDRLLADPSFLSSLMMRRYVPDMLPNDAEDPLMADSIQPRDRLQTRMEDLLMDRESPISIRDQEYLEHSSLPGHLFMQGGAGEGHQHLKPDGSVANVQVVKTDAILPAYCNPPNPCPIGYSAEDDCLEDFENSASFSRDYQSKQQCMCDQEHMFDCPGSTDESEMDTLARSISNSDLSDTFDSIANTIQDEEKEDDKDHKVVAKKFFIKKAEEKELDKKGTRTRYAVREKKGSSHSPLPWLDDISAAASQLSPNSVYSFV